MKASTLKTFIDVHTWTGLGSGLALFIAFYAGALTVFTEELDVWDHYRDAQVVQQDYVQAQALLDMALESQSVAVKRLRLDLSQADHPGNLVRWFQRLEDDSFKRHEFRLDNLGHLNTEPDRASLAGFIYRLHFTLGLPSRFGLYVLGIICVFYGMALVTGLLIFLPKFFRDLFIVRAGRNNKRFWLDTHNVVGVLSLPWHVMFAWSSAILAIGTLVLAPFQFLVFDDDMMGIIGPERGLVATPKVIGESALAMNVSDIVQIAKRQIPSLQAQQLRYSNLGDVNATVTVRGTAKVDTLSPFASVTLNASSGEILNIGNPLDASVGSTFYRGLIALHYVSFGGYIAKWLYFVLGLAGAYLFYSGNLLWIESRRKRRSVEQTRGSIFLAKLNSGVCIGCMAAISAAFLASRGFAESSNRGDITEYFYFAVFFLSLAWSFFRPLAAGARDLLFASALLTIAIPLLDLLLLDGLTLRGLLSEHKALLTIDVLAVLGALSFWRMGVAVNNRAKNGEANSVWAS